MSRSVTWAEAYLCTKCYPDPSSHFATIDMGRRLYRGRQALTVSVNWEGAGLLCTFSWGGSWVPI